jgi:hypothetical protein
MYTYGSDGNDLGYMPDNFATIINGSTSTFTFNAGDI